MFRPRLTQHQMLALFDRDRSSWYDVRHFPDSVTCRRILRFADWAARFPRHYQAARRCYEAPELSFRELAVMLGWPESTLRLRLSPVTSIDDVEDYSDIELECAGFTPPKVAVTTGCGGSPASRAAGTFLGTPEFPCRTSRTSQTSLTYQRAMAIADFAAADLTRWNVIRDYFDAECPRTQEDLARLYRVGQATISRYLESLKTIEKGLNDEYL